ncbi:GrpB family protein [Tenacibaculum tangerinum]|uniref:GrpB family protein n=1 Tax=Tenacibaculum tangerinum TaxID=3038772 RepID=A0ABY8L3I2_9FLAO|nr:GrpB family protein [Tenacibaculum tangerinum]WGH74564.1 GrpB family protein [Tenacibaculum tangerinum]
MKKTLYDLTREDWNTLFPIELSEHNPNWKSIFEAEKEQILENVDNVYLNEIEHFGSTSIPNIKAKNYIDLFIEIPKEFLFDKKLIQQFEKLGYTFFEVPAREDIEAYMSFTKGYRLDGSKEQIFHIHMCPKDNEMCKQLTFRDYLIQHPSRAKEYETLKVALASTYKNDRGAYVLGKTNFIKETLALYHSK